jgi:hypothetical protein
MSVHVSGASAPDAKAARRRRGAARRRGQLMAGLLGVALATLVAAVALGGVLLWVLQVMVDLSAVVYVTHLRRMAVLAAAARRRAVARRRDRVELAELERDSGWDQEAQWQEGVTVRRGPMQASARAAAAPVEEEIFDQTEPWDEAASPFVAAAEPMQVSVAAEDGFFDQDADFAEVAAPRRSFMETGPVRAQSTQVEPEPEPVVEPEYPNRAARAAAHAAADAAALGGKPWEPIPVPKPTYAMKPVAPSRPTRQPSRERLLPPVEPVMELQGDDDLEAILDRRWAVND